MTLVVSGDNGIAIDLWGNNGTDNQLRQFIKVDSYYVIASRVRGKLLDGRDPSPGSAMGKLERRHTALDGTAQDGVWPEGSMWVESAKRQLFSAANGALSESCTCLAYESVRNLAKERYLSHMSDSILDEYAEPAEEA